MTYDPNQKRDEAGKWTEGGIHAAMAAEGHQLVNSKASDGGFIHSYKHPHKGETIIHEAHSEQEGKHAQKMAAKKGLDAIARDHLHLETLDTRKSDSLDFAEQSVGSIKDALTAAFKQGGGKTPPKGLLEGIAKRQLDLETLEYRGSDRLDFQEQSVWGIKKALEEAEAAGKKAATSSTAKDAAAQKKAAEPPRIGSKNPALANTLKDPNADPAAIQKRLDDYAARVKPETRADKKAEQKLSQAADKLDPDNPSNPNKAKLEQVEKTGSSEPITDERMRQITDSAILAEGRNMAGTQAYDAALKRVRSRQALGETKANEVDKQIADHPTSKKAKLAAALKKEPATPGPEPKSVAQQKNENWARLSGQAGAVPPPVAKPPQKRLFSKRGNLVRYLKTTYAAEQPRDNAGRWTATNASEGHAVYLMNNIKKSRLRSGPDSMTEKHVTHKKALDKLFMTGKIGKDPAVNAKAAQHMNALEDLHGIDKDWYPDWVNQGKDQDDNPIPGGSGGSHYR